MDLEFNVNNQTLKRKDSNQVVTSSSEYLQLVFDFETDDWENLSKYAFFRTGHINYPFELTDDSIIVPAYFLNDKYLLFGLLGLGDGEVRITTNVLRLHLENSYYDSETVDVRNFLDVIVDELETEIGTKANNDDVLAWLALKADTSYVDSELSQRDSEINRKANKTYVDTELNKKSDKTYVDSELDKKANISYVDSELNERDTAINRKSDKSYVDTELSKKSDKTDTYTKTEVNNRVNVKSDKSYVDTKLDTKADKSDTYTKTEVNNRVNVKADKTYVDNQLATKVDKVTNKGLSTNDFNDTYKNKLDTLDTALNSKVDKINGKGLSTNDYTTVEKNKVALIDNKVDKVTGKGLSTNDFTNYYKNFIDGFSGDIEAFLLEHKEEIEALISQDVVDSKADKTYVDELIHMIDNKFIIKSDKQVIETGDTVDLLAKIKEDGFPVTDTRIHFFEKISPVISLSSSAPIIEIGDDTEVYARVRDTEDGSYAVNTKVHFFERIDPAIKVSASQPIIETGDDMDIYAKVYDEDGSLATNMKVHFFEEVN